MMGLLDLTSSIFSSSTLVWLAAAAFIAYTWQVQQQADKRAREAAQRARVGAGAASRTPPAVANSLTEARPAGKGAAASKDGAAASNGAVASTNQTPL